MLDARKVLYRYREYRKEPLGADELKKLLKMLGVSAKELLRKNDAAYASLGLTGKEPDAVLIPHLAANPTLLARPIAILGDRAVVGRPPEKILEILS